MQKWREIKVDLIFRSSDKISPSLTGGHWGIDSLPLKLRRPYLIIALCLFLVSFLTGCSGMRKRESESRSSRSWTRAIKQELQTLGYRNWIVVGDAAFPLHSRPGVRTIFIDDKIPEVLQEVLDELERVQNVTPRIYLAREL
ncbi:MAG: hypothetical protein CMD33_07890, partial [Flavobacteriales bacterium]|nr:hypothetical protein [Flavobacteriales bacterium]